jgi:Predicted lipoprotein of unknown function (DUF2380)
MTDRFSSAGWPVMWPDWLLNPQPGPFGPQSWSAPPTTANDFPEALASRSDPDEPSLRKGRGILADFDHWGQEPHPRFSSDGILAPLDRVNVWDQANWAASRSSALPLHLRLSQPTAAYASVPEPDGASIAAPPARDLDSAKYWGTTPSVPSEHDRSDAYGSYLSPVPRPTGWESLGPNRAGGATPNFFEPPSPLSWGDSIAGASPFDEAASAQEARAIAAQRLARRNRPAAPENVAPPVPASEIDTDMPSFREQARLNLLDSYYRSTLLGAARLASLAHLAATPDHPGIRPEIKRVRDDLRREYRQITDDLARYDRMPSFGSAGGFGAAALGQLGGGMLSPESWLGLGAKGASSLWRIAKAALQQSAVNAATDPVVQGLNIKAGVQDDYDLGRTRDAAVFGALLGGGAKLGTEALGHVGTRWFLSPADEIEWMRYNQGRRTLRGLDPFNPQLSTTAIAPWMPSRWDINRAHDQIAKLKGRGSTVLEDHHNFPKQYEDYFKHAGIDPEDYKMFVEMNDHRLRPNGLHTLRHMWNPRWKEYKDKYDNPKPEELLEHLSKMMKDVPWLKI